MKNNKLDDSDSDADSPWLHASRAHEHTFLRLVAQVANWRTFAFISLAIAGIAVAGAIYIGQQSKFIPYLVEVDKLGRTVAVRAVNGDDATADPKKIIYSAMFDLIEDLRSVSTDTVSNDYHLERGFLRLKGAGYEYVKSELRKAKPNDIGQTKTVQVKVTLALPA